MKFYIKYTSFILAMAIVLTAKSRAADYIKWVDFTVCESAMHDALKIDTETYGSGRHLRMCDSLACLAVKYGGNFSRYKKDDLLKIKEKYTSGEKLSEIAKNDKLFAYYTEAYTAIFGSLVCEYDVYTVENGEIKTEREYGLSVYSPIAEGYYYSHYDDFGSSRSYGYKRKHLGHDLMGSVGTPIVATEAGYVEACGWNRYGGWRVGIRSFDGKRYYYYAHLRKNHPYADMYEGKVVAAGEVIGYLGMTGYSVKENVNNIDTPHLHYGLQLIFDKSQKDGTNQIWLDMYAFTNFLSKYKAKTVSDGGERKSVTYKIPVSSWD